MKIARVQILNFRLLRNADIALDDAATMIVGRNNSGKTSVVEIIRKVFGSDHFSFDDLSIDARGQFQVAYDAYAAFQSARAGGDEEEAAKHEGAARLLPEISVAFTVAYEDTDDLTPLAPFILDLDPSRMDATFGFHYAIKDPASLFDAFNAAKEQSSIPLTEFVRKNYGAFGELRQEAWDAQDPNTRRKVTDPELEALVSVDFIYAQNQFDDLSSDRNHALSKSFESFYNANREDNTTAAHIDALLATASGDLDARYVTLFKSVFDDLKLFGVTTMSGLPPLTLVAELQSLKVLSGSTRLYYDDNGGRLPEAHNGLGYSKLIYTILKFIGFYEDLRRAKPRPAMQLIFVEEPEAHLHPQMQSVFVKNIRQFVSSKPDWKAQTVITTHSSHVVADSGFSCIRYFDNSVNPLKVRDLSQFQADLAKTTDGKGTLKFLQQYMELARCDMFFADKVVLIEGAVERLLLPGMISKAASTLHNQYVSTIEVGGAYAHKFKGLLEFLNVQTLVITDIDSVGGDRKAVAVEDGVNTSNPTLRDWLPKVKELPKLLGVKDAAKRSGRVAVSYEVPEAKGDRTGRSFEEAFILANAAQFAASSGLSHQALFQHADRTPMLESEIKSNAYAIAGGIKKKPDFAFDVLLLASWTTPRYIREGLEWLSKTP